MNPLFRSIRRKLLDEGNLVRCLTYAVGEITLIIIGILFALQINNWNEDRKAQDEFDFYLAQLKVDVEQAITNANEAITTTDKTFISRFELIIPFLEQSEHEPEEIKTFENAIRWLGLYPEAQIHVGLLGQLLNGNMEVISRDKELALRAMRMESVVEDKMAIIHHNYDWLDSYHANLSKFRGGIGARTKKPLYNLDELRASSEFAYTVKSITSGMKTIKDFTEQMADELEDFLAVLEEYE